MTNLKQKLFVGIALSATTMLVAGGSFATEGYFTHGAGARNKAMGGAGVADGRDATALIVNPAGMVGNGTELDVSISLFKPTRQFTGTGGPGFTTNNVNKSSENLFGIPNIAYVKAIDDTSSWGVSIAANGGMNTNYRDVSNPACVSPPLPAPNGVFCGGTTGINLVQALVSVGYAKQMGNFKIGIAPIFGFQQFEATGLFAFGKVSSNPDALSNNGSDTSTGFGGKIGIEFSPIDRIRIGGTYQSKISMSEFDKYAGLFADAGDFDIPSNYQVGISADIMHNLTVSADYKHIKYSDTPAVSNSSRVQLPFGAPGAAGFGWDDIDIYKIGVEYLANDKWTLRAGYAHNDQPVSGDDITLNILAPGVVTDHFTGGGAIKINDRNTLEFGIMYAPNEAVSGIEVTSQGPNPTHIITAEMKQFEVTVGWKLKFGN
ncbi:MAG: outer membrane protein transport protein [Robiginitomaculum sp.]